MLRGITYHAVADWKRCRWKWYLAHELCLEPIEKRPALELGGLWHQVMALYYKVPYEYRSYDTIKRYITEVINAYIGEETDHIFLSKAEDYYIKLNLMADSFWGTIGKDELFSVGNVEEDYALSLNDILLVAHPDLIRIKEKKLYLGEHKTGKDPDLEFYTMFDEQKYFYAYVISKVKGIEKVECVYTIAQVPTSLTKLPKVERITFPMDMNLIKTYGDELSHIVREIGNLPLFPTRNLTCNWSCVYYPICRTALSGGDARYIAQTQYRIREVENVGDEEAE